MKNHKTVMKTRKGSKTYLSSSERYLTLHIILDTDPKMKIPNHNKKDRKVLMEYNYIPRPNFSK